MGFLSSLLPGLRSLRAPLSAGFIWLFNVWLVAGDAIQDREKASLLHHRIYDLGAPAPEILLVILGFLAYLVGSISLQLSGVLSRPQLWLAHQMASITKRRTRLVEGWTPQYEYARFVDSETSVAAANRSRGTSRLGSDLHSEATRALGEPRLREEVPLIRARLMAEQPALYGEFDRLKSEVEFRNSVALPLLVTLLILAIGDSLWWLFGLVGILLLSVQAIRLDDEAHHGLVAAVTAGKIEAPYVERFAQALDDIASGRFEE